MSTDVESPAPSTTPPGTDACGIPKRRQLFILFGLVSISWCVFLVYMMHDVHIADRQSYMDNLDYKGADIDSIFGVETANECYRRCEKHESCLAYTFVKSEHVCWLKGGGWTAKSNPNTISGAINATLAAIRRSSSPGANSSYDPAWGEEGESYRAREDERWDGRKWQERDMDDDEYRDDEGVYSSASVRVSAEEIERYEDNTDYFGDVRVFANVRSVSECASSCASEAACAAWSLDKAHSLCLLRLAGVSPVRFSSDFVSARLTAAEIAERARDRASLANSTALDESVPPPYTGPPWPLPAELTSPRALDNVDLLGGDERHVSGVESLAECRAVCARARDVACVAFTLSKATGFCWLKNASYVRAPQNRSKGLISGVLALDDNATAAVAKTSAA